MAIKIGINGFGRIGRQVFRIMKERGGFDVVGANDLTDAKTLAHLLKYDSVHGRFDADVKVDGDDLVCDGDRVPVMSEKDPAKLPWKNLGAEIVIESTGKFRDREGASKHLAAGAKRVLLSAPGKDPDWTVVLGVNGDEYDADKHFIISNASCTTNCLAPVAKVLLDEFGLSTGIMTTIHAYTNDQRILDFPHKDLRRARAAAVSMIPTTTGAAKAIGLVIPELKGKLDGFAIRVPTPNVSMVDLSAILEKETSAEAINEAMTKAAAGPMKGILEVSTEPLVSIDYNHSSASSVVDAELTKVLDGRLAKVIAWYDNEWGYSERLVDLAQKVA
ncbi:MAG: type I glyceraldehyde-3-phosphate dehydrogenase [Candidatus Coatesbacteria bacterium]|nr:MAG: type I glyceraldehyde-3-phosphate dehydrogenase [Candidatus Coatesbacteria bacterium]